MVPFVVGWWGGGKEGGWIIDGAGAGDCVAPFSSLTRPRIGELEFALLDGRAGSDVVVACDVPLVVGPWLVWRPLTPAWTIWRWRRSASLSTMTPGAGDPRCWERLSMTFGFDAPSLILGPAGSSTFSLASARIVWKCSWMIFSIEY